jgi:hypothetical protein
MNTFKNLFITEKNTWEKFGSRIRYDEPHGSTQITAIYDDSNNKLTITAGDPRHPLEIKSSDVGEINDFIDRSNKKLSSKIPHI